MTFSKPALPIIANSSSCGGRYAVDAGRYEYALTVGEQSADERHDAAEPQVVYRTRGRAGGLADIEQRDATVRTQYPSALGEHGRQVDEVP